MHLTVFGIEMLILSCITETVLLYWGRDKKSFGEIRRPVIGPNEIGAKKNTDSLTDSAVIASTTDVQ